MQQLYSERFTIRLRHKHIKVKDVTAILNALKNRISLRRASQLIFHSDNLTLAKGAEKTSIPSNAMHTSRAVVVLFTQNDIFFRSPRISTKENNVAD